MREKSVSKNTVKIYITSLAGKDIKMLTRTIILIFMKLKTIEYVKQRHGKQEWNDFGKKLNVHHRHLKLNICKIFANNTKIYVSGIPQKVKGEQRKEQIIG